MHVWLLRVLVVALLLVHLGCCNYAGSEEEHGSYLESNCNVAADECGGDWLLDDRDEEKQQAFDTVAGTCFFRRCPVGELNEVILHRALVSVYSFSALLSLFFVLFACFVSLSHIRYTCGPLSQTCFDSLLHCDRRLD